MERLTNNKKVSEMSMYELAHNSCYAEDGRARYRDYEIDIDARELTIKLLEQYADIPNEFTGDDDFDDFMLESLQYSTDSILGLITVFYRNLWAMADLREQLKGYEDIGLTPWQFKEIDKLYSEKCRELADAQRSSFSGLEMVKIWAKLKKLKEYHDLEEQGKLLKLPCAVGDIIWDIDFGRPCGYEVTGFSFGSLNDDDWEEEKVLDQVVVYYTNSNGSITGTFAVSEIGKTVFLTREEAEAAVKEMSKCCGTSR